MYSLPFRGYANEPSFVRPFQVDQKQESNIRNKSRNFNYVDNFEKGETIKMPEKQISEHRSYDRNTGYSFTAMNNFEHENPNQTAGNYEETPIQKQTNVSIMEENLDDNNECLTERLGSLQSKLYNDADKIRKWRITIENDLHIKKLTIQENQEVIENQRKSIYELQIQNEKMSHDINEEQRNRNDVNLKMQSTRELVLVVKTQMEKLNNNITFCNEKVVLFDSLNNQRLQDLEDLNEKFKFQNLENLEIVQKLNETHQNEMSQMEDQFNNQMIKAEEHLQQIHEALKDKFDQQVTLEKRITELTDLESELSQKLELSNNNERVAKELIENSKQEQSNLNQKLANLEAEIVEKNVKLSELDEKIKQCDETDMQSREMLSTMRQNIYTSEKSFAETKRTLEETLAEAVHRSNDLEQQLFISNTTIEDITKNCENIQKCLNEANNEIISANEAKNQLIENKNELEEQIEQQKKHFKELETVLSVKNNEISQFKSDLMTSDVCKEQLQIDLKQTQKELINKTDQLELLKNKLDQLMIENERCEGEINNFSSEVEQNKEKIEGLNANINRLNDENKKLEATVKETMEDLEESKEYVEELKNENSEITEKLETITTKFNTAIEKIFKLEKEVADKLNIIESLQDGMQSEITQEKQAAKDKIVKLEKAITEKSKMIESLEDTAKIITQERQSAKTECQLKNKSIKDLEKEIKATNSNLKSKTRDLTKLQESTTEKDVKLTEINQERDNLLIESKSLKSSLEETKRLLKTATKESGMAKSDCDAKMKDMMRTMEQQQLDFQRNIVQKDKDLQNERKKNFELLKASENTEIQNFALEDIQNEKKKVEDANRKLKVEMKTCEDLCSKLKNELKLKNEDYRKIAEELKEMKIEEDRNKLKQKEITNKNKIFVRDNIVSPNIDNGDSSDSSAIDLKDILRFKLKNKPAELGHERKQPIQNMAKKKLAFDCNEKNDTPQKVAKMSPKINSLAKSTASYAIKKNTSNLNVRAPTPKMSNVRNAPRKFFTLTPGKKSIFQQEKPKGIDWMEGIKPKDVYDFSSNDS